MNSTYFCNTLLKSASLCLTSCCAQNDVGSFVMILQEREFGLLYDVLSITLHKCGIEVEYFSFIIGHQCRFWYLV